MGEPPNDTYDECESQFVPGDRWYETGDYCPEATGDKFKDRCECTRQGDQSYESIDLCPDGLNDDIDGWPQGGDSCPTFIAGGSFEIGDVCPTQHAADQDYDFCNTKYADYEDVE